MPWNISNTVKIPCSKKLIVSQWLKVFFAVTHIGAHTHTDSNLQDSDACGQKGAQNKSDTLIKCSEAVTMYQMTLSDGILSFTFSDFWLFFQAHFQEVHGHTAS